MSNVETWNKTDGSNTDPLKSGAPEGMKRSDVNDRMREMLGAVRRYYDDPEFLDLARNASGDSLTISWVSDTEVRVENFDMTPYTPAGRRVRMSASGGAYTYAHIVSASFSTHTDITLETFSGAGMVVPAGVDLLQFHSGSTLGKLAFLDSQGFGFYVPVSADSAGIQGAIDAANTAGGGIVLLGDAAYAIDAQINLKSDVVLFGAGPPATVLTVDASITADSILMSSRSACIGFTINGSAQTPGAYDAIRVVTSGVECTIQNLRIEGAPRNGINIGLSANKQITVRDVLVDAPAVHGVIVQDALDTATQILVDSVTVVNPGAGSTNDVAGVYAAGAATISNITVTLERASPKVQRGVWLKAKDISGTQEAERTSVMNVLVQGSGALARGIEVSGESCSVVGGVINLSGATSRGVIIDATAGGGQVANRNLVSDLVILGADVGVQLAADAYDNLVSDCQIIDAITNAVEDGGTKNCISGLRVEAPVGGVTSISLTGSASKSHVSDCYVEHVSAAGTCIAIATSASDCVIRGNTLRDAATGISVAAGATDNFLVFNAMIGTTASLADSSTSTSMYGNVQDTDRVRAEVSSNYTPVDASAEDWAPELSSVRLPGLVPDGSRRWRIRGVIDFGSPTRMGILRVRIGPNGASASDTLYYAEDCVSFAAYDGNNAIYRIPISSIGDTNHVASGSTTTTYHSSVNTLEVKGDEWGDPLANAAVWAAGLVVQPAAGDVYLSVSWDPYGTDSVYRVNAPSYIEIEYIG